jgi:hypothetical protein
MHLSFRLSAYICAEIILCNIITPIKKAFYTVYTCILFVKSIHKTLCGNRKHLSQIYFCLCFDSILYTFFQCSGSMTFWCGSGSADPCLWLIGLDACYFVIDLQDANQKLIKKKKKVFCFLLFEGTFTSFFKDKKYKKSHKTVGIKVFLTIFS